MTSPCKHQSFREAISDHLPISNGEDDAVKNYICAIFGLCFLFAPLAAGADELDEIIDSLIQNREKQLQSGDIKVDSPGQAKTKETKKEKISKRQRTATESPHTEPRS